MNTEKRKKLFAEDIHIVNWGRKFAERELIKTESLFISRQFKTASERYKELIKNHPDLILRVQLGYVASYLGITTSKPESHKVRNKIKPHFLSFVNTISVINAELCAKNRNELDYFDCCRII